MRVTKVPYGLRSRLGTRAPTSSDYASLETRALRPMTLPNLLLPLKVPPPLDPDVVVRWRRHQGRRVQGKGEGRKDESHRP